MDVRQRTLGFLLWLIYRLLASTWKITVLEDEKLREDLRLKLPVIFAHWHGDEIPIVALIPRYRVATLISQSKDGQLMDTVVHLQGGGSARGSSTRGGAAGLLGLVRTVRKHKFNVSMAVDGPKGPRHQVKHGVFEMSRVLQARIYPTGASCTRAWHFEKSWNLAYLPKPFARITIDFGKPLEPVVDAKDVSLKSKLEEALHKSRVAAVAQAVLA